MTDDTAHGLEFRIHLVDGSSLAFAQSNPQAIRKNLERFDPHKLFTQPYFSIESPEGVTIIPSSRITHLELKLDPDPGWSIGARKPETKMQVVTRAVYEEVLGNGEGADLSRRERQAGEDFRGFAAIALAGHQEVIVEIQTRVAIALDQKMMLEGLLGLRTVFFPRGAGEYVFINTANILRLEIRPGQPNIAPLAWLAEPLAAQAIG